MFETRRGAALLSEREVFRFGTCTLGTFLHEALACGKPTAKIQTSVRISFLSEGWGSHLIPVDVHVVQALVEDVSDPPRGHQREHQG